MNYELYNIFGAHKKVENSIAGVRFTVYAPNAKSVSVVGNFNNWSITSNFLEKTNIDGVWSVFIPNLIEGESYKYYITSIWNDSFFKCDPFAFFSEVRPNTASKIYDPFKEFPWKDESWEEKKRSSCIYSSPISIYEIHLDYWKRDLNKEILSKNEKEFLNYKEIADLLIPHLKEIGFTHVELLPITWNPLDIQEISCFSITSRYGTPEDFKYFVNRCHLENIGVILNWTPCNFWEDNGINLFFRTSNLDFINPFVKEFLISNAHFLFKYFHIDGLRIDNISNLLSSKYNHESSILKNTNEKKAIDFFKELNTVIFNEFNNPLMITSWPANDGGLGFNFKWNIRWMNDMLRYISLSPEDRERYHNLLTFSLMYSFNENFILPLSYNEIAHEKKSFLDMIRGNYNEKFSSLKMFYAFLFGYPGKKLFFMENEITPFIEQKYYKDLEWKLLTYSKNNSLKKCLCDLHSIYKNEPSFFELDFSPEGFKWINHKNHSQKIISFIRKSKKSDDFILVVCNFTAHEFINHHIGVPRMAEYQEIFNSDKDIYNGSNHINKKVLKPLKRELDEQPFSISINIAPMTTIFFKPIFKRKNNSYKLEKY